MVTNLEFRSGFVTGIVGGRQVNCLLNPSAAEPMPAAGLYAIQPPVEDVVFGPVAIMSPISEADGGASARAFLKSGGASAWKASVGGQALKYESGASAMAGKFASGFGGQALKYESGASAMAGKYASGFGGQALKYESGASAMAGKYASGFGGQALKYESGASAMAGKFWDKAGSQGSFFAQSNRKAFGASTKAIEWGPGASVALFDKFVGGSASLTDKLVGGAGGSSVAYVLSSCAIPGRNCLVIRSNYSDIMEALAIAGGATVRFS